MTKACEKLFKKLSRTDQKAIRSRIEDIQNNPSNGRPLKGDDFDGQLHTHARGRSSNLLVIWSYEDNPERIIIEAVGPHKIIDWLGRQLNLLKDDIL